MNDADVETIISARLHGLPVRTIAKQLKCTTDQVNDVLDVMAQGLTPAYRLRAISVDLERLEVMHRVFFRKAVEGCVNSGELCLKIAARRAAILGSDSPTRVDVLQLQEAAHPPLSTTDKILQALDRLGNVDRHAPAVQGEISGPADRDDAREGETASAGALDRPV